MCLVLPTHCVWFEQNIKIRILSKISASAVFKEHLCKVAYAETHFLQDKLNSAIALY